MLLGLIRPLARNIISVRSKVILMTAIAFIVMVYTGVLTHLFEKDYAEFAYPLEGDILPIINRLRKGLSPPDFPQPINVFNYTFLKECRNKCEGMTDGPRLLFVVKSARQHFERRRVIRETWGNERRFPHVTIRTVFLLGAAPPGEVDMNSQRLIDEEYATYNDIIESDFVDAYFNNTLKTRSGLKWVVEQCSSAHYIAFSDDDMYISTKNVLRFIQNPFNYPDYDDGGVKTRDLKSKDHRQPTLRQHQAPPADDEKGDRLESLFYGGIGNGTAKKQDLKIYAGFVYYTSPWRLRASKWYMPLNEYPFNRFPPFIPAGAYILSRSALLDLYYASAYVKSFRFDDVFLGLVARKTTIVMIHSPEFFLWDNYWIFRHYDFRNAIAFHGYGNPAELKEFWNKQKASGHA